MSRLGVLGSGSRGNASVLEVEGALLLLDCGFSARETERRLGALGFDPGALAGIALTHEHGDHAQGVDRLARRHGVPVLASAGTLGALGDRLGGVRCHALTVGQSVACGPFAVEGAPTSHDAAEPFALGVRMSDGSSAAVAYDLGRPTGAVRLLLRERTALVLEANHDELMLRAGPYPPSVQERIAGSGGHLSNRVAAELVAEVAHAGLAHVVLAHLSERCNTPDVALQAIGRVLRRGRFGGVLHVAPQDVPLGPLAVEAPRAAQLAFGL